MMALPFGAFHRRIVAIVESGRVRAALEDESHHMEVTVTHDGQHVTGIDGTTYRIPWSTCPAAVAKVKELIGLPLQRVNKTTGLDAKEQCTHLFDLTRIAIARAAVNTSVQYDVAVPDRIERRTQPELLCNGKPILTWDVDDYALTGPELYAGHNLRGAPKWPAGLDDDTIEAAIVLRRTIMLSMVRMPEAAAGREGNLPDGELNQIIKAEGRTGRCYTYQLPMFDTAKQMRFWNNFAERRDDLLANFAGVRSIAEMARSSHTKPDFSAAS
jgi:hypothetical protein